MEGMDHPAFVSGHMNEAAGRCLVKDWAPSQPIPKDELETAGALNMEEEIVAAATKAAAAQGGDEGAILAAAIAAANAATKATEAATTTGKQPSQPSPLNN
jgi:hypothetical protein